MIKRQLFFHQSRKLQPFQSSRRGPELHQAGRCLQLLPSVPLSWCHNSPHLLWKDKINALSLQTSPRQPTYQSWIPEAETLYLNPVRSLFNSSKCNMCMCCSIRSLRSSKWAMSTTLWTNSERNKRSKHFIEKNRTSTEFRWAPSSLPMALLTAPTQPSQVMATFRVTVCTRPTAVSASWTLKDNCGFQVLLMQESSNFMRIIPM